MALESLIDALLVEFAAVFPDLLADAWAAQAAADGARGTAVPLVLPGQYLYGRRMPDYLEDPLFMVWEEQTETLITGQGAGIGTADPHNWMENEHRLVVGVVLVSDDEEILERSLSRYRAALLQFFREHSAIFLSGITYALTVEHVGRETRAGSLRYVHPGERGLFCDITATVIEES